MTLRVPTRLLLALGAATLWTATGQLAAQQIDELVALAAPDDRGVEVGRLGGA